MKTTHFEIGQVIGQSNLDSETQSVFTADSLAECVKEWKEKGYTSPEYFIDVWEK